MLWIKTHTSPNISGTHGRSAALCYDWSHLCASVKDLTKNMKHYHAIYYATFNVLVQLNFDARIRCISSKCNWPIIHYLLIFRHERAYKNSLYFLCNRICEESIHELFLKVSCSAEWSSVIGGMFNGLTWPPKAKPNAKIKYLNCMLALRFLNWNVLKWASLPFMLLKLGCSTNFCQALAFIIFWTP